MLAIGMDLISRKLSGPYRCIRTPDIFDCLVGDKLSAAIVICFSSPANFRRISAPSMCRYLNTRWFAPTGRAGMSSCLSGIGREGHSLTDSGCSDFRRFLAFLLEFLPSSVSELLDLYLAPRRVADSDSETLKGSTVVSSENDRPSSRALSSSANFLHSSLVQMSHFRPLSRLKKTPVRKRCDRFDWSRLYLSRTRYKQKFFTSSASKCRFRSVFFERKIAQSLKAFSRSAF